MNDRHLLGDIALAVALALPGLTLAGTAPTVDKSVQHQGSLMMKAQLAESGSDRSILRG